MYNARTIIEARNIEGNMAQALELNDWYKNQLKIFHPAHYEPYKVAIIGVGALGSWTAMALTKMGCKIGVIIDPDKVSATNVANQAYSTDHIASSKVTQVAKIIEINGPMKQKTKVLQGKVEHKEGKAVMDKSTLQAILDCDIVVCTPDNMDARILTLAIVSNKSNPIRTDVIPNGKTKLLIEARANGEMFVIHTVDLTKDTKWYVDTLYEDKDAVQETCSQRGIVYTGMICGALIANQLKKVFNAEPYDKQITFDCKSMQLFKE